MIGNRKRGKRIAKVMITSTLALFLFIQSTISVQAEPEKVLPSGVSYLEIGTQIEQYMEEHKETTAGVAISVFDKEETIFETTSGYGDIENQIEIDENSVFEWGNVSQLLIWTSLMQLYESGQLDLETDIREYLPEGSLGGLNDKSPITVLDLMNQTGGFQKILAEINVRKGVAYDDFLPTLSATVPTQVYPVGNVVAYSTWGCGLAAYVVECVSGMEYADYVQTNIFEPLGMEHTALKPDYTDNEWVASARNQMQGYQGTNLIVSNQYNVPIYPIGMVTGTEDDFLLFAKAISCEGNGTKIFEKEETRELFLSSSLNYRGTEDARICHGLWVYRYAVPVVGCDGNSMTHSATLLIDPQTGVGVTVMTNQFNETVYTNEMMPLVFGSIELPTEQGNLRSMLDYEGRYLSADTITKGKISFYHLTSLIRFQAIDPHTFGTTLTGELPYLQQFTDSYCVTPIGTVAHLYTFEDGTKVIENQYSDLLEYSEVQYIAEWIVIILMLLLYLYSTLTLFLSFARFLYHKIYKHTKEETSFRKFHYIQCLNVTVYVLCYGFMIMSALSYASVNFINSFSMLYWVSTVMSFVYVLFYLRNGIKAEVGKVEKYLYATTAVGSLILIAFGITFQIII